MSAGTFSPGQDVDESEWGGAACDSQTRSESGMPTEVCQWMGEPPQTGAGMSNAKSGADVPRNPGCRFPPSLRFGGQVDKAAIALATRLRCASAGNEQGPP
jgi:hypothetical protein